MVSKLLSIILKDSIRIVARSKFTTLIHSGQPYLRDTPKVQHCLELIGAKYKASQWKVGIQIGERISDHYLEPDSDAYWRYWERSRSLPRSCVEFERQNRTSPPYSWQDYGHLDVEWSDILSEKTGAWGDSIAFIPSWSFLKIDPYNQLIYLDGAQVRYQRLISTIPLPIFYNILFDDKIELAMNFVSISNHSGKYDDNFDVILTPDESFFRVAKSPYGLEAATSNLEPCAQSIPGYPMIRTQDDLDIIKNARSRLERLKSVFLLGRFGLWSHSEQLYTSMERIIDYVIPKRLVK